MAKLFNTIGTSTSRSLLADPEGSDIIVISCVPGNGTVEMGTIMVRQDNGMYAPAAAADIIANKNLVVLDEDVDTNEDANVGQNANAYRSGRLLASRVKISGGEALTAAHKLVLRAQGIMLNQMAGEAEEFNNSTT